MLEGHVICPWIGAGRVLFTALIVSKGMERGFILETSLSRGTGRESLLE